MQIKNFRTFVRPAALLPACFFVFFGSILITGMAPSARGGSLSAQERQALFAASPVSDSLSKVYVCTGPKAYAYHIDRRCEFLNNCGSRIDTVTLKVALSMGRKCCKSCNRGSGR